MTRLFQPRGIAQDTVLYEVRDKIATITLNRPERVTAINVVIVAMVDQLPEVWRQFDSDDDAHVAIACGAGEKAFCAGGDLKEMAEGSVQHIYDKTESFAGVRYPTATYQFETGR
ncbi:enoyl-CoA hydratase/isomerase family protein [Streptomyces sp. NPDC002758]